jgi:hypothetical protein
MPTRMVGALSAGLIAVLLLSGCGAGSKYANTPRPPAPINVAISLTNGGVLVSPARVGAGPVVLLVANESGRSRDVTLTAPAGASSSCVEATASSGPINPQGVARLPVQLVRGECVVGVRDAGLRPAHLIVGAERTSAQADVLQP